VEGEGGPYEKVVDALGFSARHCELAFSGCIDAGYGILGTITDPTGAVIANAVVSITQTATGVRRETQTAADGKYEVR
jgi:hypothetical protein